MPPPPAVPPLLETSRPHTHIIQAYVSGWLTWLPAPSRDPPPPTHAYITQAYVRGWLVRRGQQLWWARNLAGLKGRRTAAAAWTRHQGRMRETLGIQAQAREACVCEQG